AVTGPLAGEAAAGARGLLGDATIAGRGGLLDMPGIHHDGPPVAGHTPVEPPSVHPGPVADHPVPTVDHPAPAVVGDHSMPSTPHDAVPLVTDHPVPTAGDHWSPQFDPNGGQHYASGDPHHPGGWPPHTPEATWSKGDSNPGWEHINRGPVKDWMDYQAQISGVERTPDGRIPEYVRIDPETGDPVKFDGHTFRGGQEVYLDAKQGYSALATDVGKPWANGMADGLLKEIPRQLDAMPPGAILEVHVSDPIGAQAIRNLLDNADLFVVREAPTADDPDGEALPKEGYSFIVSGSGTGVDVDVRVAAGSVALGRRVPRHTLSIDLRETQSGSVTGEHGTAVCAAVARIWAPSSFKLTDSLTNSAARRGGWKIGVGYRTWISAEVGAINHLVDRLTATEIAGGTLISAPDDWPAPRVVEAMTATLRENGLDEVPH
ncbi:Uncharacterised protein, partial [Aduncisulcus paluster]